MDISLRLVTRAAKQGDDLNSLDVIMIWKIVKEADISACELEKDFSNA